MKFKKLNVFLLDENPITGAELKEYILSRFTDGVKIWTFTDEKKCLEKINNTTHLLIINDVINGKSGTHISKSIKEINPKTKVLTLSEHEDIVLTIESFREKAKGVVAKDLRFKNKMALLLITVFAVGTSVLLYFIFYK